MRTKEITLGAVTASLVFAFLPVLANPAQGATNSLPTNSTSQSTPITNPANQPDDLVALARVETQAVVTIQCATEVGSAWSAQVDFNAQLQAAGYKSYLVTNYHVVKSCSAPANIQITLNDQSKATGILWAWDESQDVAAVVTTASVPSLLWSGDQPASGWWVGIIGSPLGFPGVLTEGIISSVNSSLSKATTSASINPGNSGGPAFDRSGRVIGLATSKYANSEGMGILNGTPLLCGTVIQCNSPSLIWNTSTTTITPEQVKLAVTRTTTTTTSEIELNEAAVMLLTSTRQMLAQAKEDVSSAITKYPKQSATLAKLMTTTPSDPVIDNDVDDVLKVALFANEVSAFVKKANSAISDARTASTKPAPVAVVAPKSTTTKVVTIDPKISSSETTLKSATTKTTLKTKTITCVNPLKSLKVTGVNVKCPLGFTLKTVITL